MKRVFALFLSIVMLFSLFPSAAFAEEIDILTDVVDEQLAPPVFTPELPQYLTIITPTDELTVGETVQLSADAYAVWSSSDEAVLTVDQNGLVTAVSVGTATVRADAFDGSGRYGEIELTVNEAETVTVVEAVETEVEEIEVTEVEEPEVAEVEESEVTEVEESEVTVVEVIEIEEVEETETELYLSDGENFSSQCGANLTWSLDENGTLTISGTGAMDNYQPGPDTQKPWSVCHNLVKAIVINEGVSTIGDCAFTGFGDIEQISLPDSIVSIGQSAFASCGLTSVTIPASVESIGDYAFGETSLNEASFLGTEEEWSDVYVGEGNDALINVLSFETEPVSENYLTFSSDNYFELSLSGTSICPTASSTSVTMPSSTASCPERLSFPKVSEVSAASPLPSIMKAEARVCWSVWSSRPVSDISVWAPLPTAPISAVSFTKAPRGCGQMYMSTPTIRPLIP